MIRPFVAALQFLTICPWVGSIPCEERQIGRSSVWFPAVGVLIGLCAAGVDFVVLSAFGKTVADVFAILFLVFASGGLHADGLADMGDGFFSARSKERILEIMRDSRIGTMGALFLGAVFSMKWAAFGSLPAELRWETLVMMPLAGRCAMLFHLSFLDYARKDSGLCTVFVRERTAVLPWLAAIWLGGFGWFALGWMGVGSLVATAGAAALVSVWCAKKIGGFTGDTLGACSEGAEVLPPLVVLAWLHFA